MDTESTSRIWRELIQETRICELCGTAMLRTELVSHLHSHSNVFGIGVEVEMEYDKFISVEEVTTLNICPYCNQIPPETFQNNPTNAMIKHIKECPYRNKEHTIRWRTVRDRVMINELFLQCKNGVTMKVFFCPKHDDGFADIEMLLDHYASDHCHSLQKTEILNKQSERRISETLEKYIISIQQNTTEELSTTINSILLIRPTSIKSHTLRPSVPRPRSILKKLAGILEDDENLTDLNLTTNANIKSTIIEDEDETSPQSGMQSQYRLILSYIYLRFGDIPLHWTLRQWARGMDKIFLKDETGEKMPCNVNRTDKLLEGGATLANWYVQNNIIAGAYLYFYRTESQNLFEIAYVPTQKVMKCLVADWDNNAGRIVLSYQDITVQVECSEHLFRSSINLEDQRVLKIMAKMYGSVFDVLYLGMRELQKKGYERIHYRDLHNMVMEKRLHPRLETVAVELGKNSCFIKLGDGYWAFSPDPRIEKILPQVEKQSRIPEIEEIITSRTEKETPNINESPIVTVMVHPEEMQETKVQTDVPCDAETPAQLAHEEDIALVDIVTNTDQKQGLKNLDSIITEPFRYPDALSAQKKYLWKELWNGVLIFFRRLLNIDT